MTTIGLIGAGHIGSQIARARSGNGYDVVISNSRGPETLIRRSSPSSDREPARRQPWTRRRRETSWWSRCH